MIKIKKLTKKFDGIVALDTIDLELAAGKIIGLVGPDGTGKTTLLRLIAGLLKPTTGSIAVNGLDTITEANGVHEIISYMPQKFGLYEDLTVMQNLTLYADLQGLSREERERQFKRLLDFTALAPFTKRYAQNLSGGMKQKLGLACTLLRKPKLLLLDEPTAGVDPISRRELWKMTSELATEGITVIWSTAYLDEAEKCDEVILLSDGKLLFFGAPKALTDKLERRTFQIRDITTDRRAVLMHALRDEAVMDGTIQGSSVRILLSDAAKIPDIQTFNPGEGAKLVSVEPRFEDGFIDKLGGGPGGYSKIAEMTPMIPLEERPVVEVKGLTKKFGDFVAAHNITFEVKRGEIFGLLGPNGAGKSTTFKMLCGLLKQTEGSARVAGYLLKEATHLVRERIGYMAQKFSLYDNMTVLQNLSFFAGIYANHKKPNIDEMIETFALTPYLNTSSAQLPLGFKQRLALSCALMHKPEILFLDEPTSGVDPITRREFWNHINGLVEKGVAIIVTTHFMDEAEYCDRIGLINQGELIKIGTPDDLKNSVRSAELPAPTLADAFILLSTSHAKT